MGGLKGTGQDAVIGSNDPHLVGKRWKSIIDDPECQETGFRHQRASELKSVLNMIKSHVR